MQAPHFVQVNRRQTQTHIGFKIFVKLHSDLYNPFFYEIFYNISLQKRLNEKGIQNRKYRYTFEIRQLKFSVNAGFPREEQRKKNSRFQKILNPAFAKNFSFLSQNLVIPILNLSVDYEFKKTLDPL